MKNLILRAELAENDAWHGHSEAKAHQRIAGDSY